MHHEAPTISPLPQSDLADDEPYAIITQDVHKRFGGDKRPIQAIDGISIRVRPGQVTGLIGPDGAGKTTLMRLIAGLLTPDSGSLTVLGMDVRTQALDVQSSLGYMPQHFGLYEDLTVQENLNLYADLQGLPHTQRPARYQQLLAMTGLAPFTNRLAGRLSGGMKQKLGLACTLMRPPRLLLLDEPTVGVDPVSRRELWQIVYQLVADEGMSVLLSTAYLDEAERCADVILVHEGRVLGQGDPAHFTRFLEHRVYCVRQKTGLKRHLQARINAESAVMDAVIDGDCVRAILKPNTPPPTMTNVCWRLLPPRFEDAFVVHLQEQVRTETPQVTPVEDVPLAAGHPVNHSPVIEVHNLTRRFGRFIAVDNLSFSVQRGEIFGLLGANGAGKSTTFRMLCGLLPASSGQLSVAGMDLHTAAAQARARIGYMSQRFALYEVLSCEQNLKFFARTYGLTGQRQVERIAWAIQSFDLEPYRHTNSGILPLGFKQRLAMAAALMHKPEILFLDEPTSGVDPIERRAFWNRINALADQGVTILITTHFMDEAEYCDRLVIMSRGAILAEGSPSDIRALARTDEHPNPRMEDAFIHLVTERPIGEAGTQHA